LTRLRHPVFPVSWLVVTTIAFLLPGSAIPKVNWLDKIWFDKWVHAGIFIVMVVAWTYMLSYKVKKPVAYIAIVVTVFCLLYGIIIELLQHYLVLNRSFDLGDIAADAAGCLVGLFLAGRYIKK
jgi:VanZ family protein